MGRYYILALVSIIMFQVGWEHKMDTKAINIEPALFFVKLRGGVILWIGSHVMFCGEVGCNWEVLHFGFRAHTIFFGGVGWGGAGLRRY